MQVSGFSLGGGEFGDQVHLLGGRDGGFHRGQFEHGGFGEIAAVTPDDGSLYLPGLSNPELTLKALVETYILEGRSFELIPRVDPEALRLALEQAAGLDDHDWLEMLALKLGGMRATIGQLLSICLEDADFLANSNELVADLRKAARL